jgi:WD40 repeat protein
MKFKLYLITSLLFLSSFNLFSQEYEDFHPYLYWKQIETKHFFINFHEGTENTAYILAKIAEEVYPAITEIYNYEPDSKISLIVKDHSDYSNGAAYYYDNKIELWASSLDVDLRGTHNWLRNVFTHEFTHMIQLQTSMKFGRKLPAFYLQWMGYESERRPDVLDGFPNVMVSYPIPGVSIPAWFAEGTAQYNNPDIRYDFWDSHRDMLLRMYALRDSLLSWGDMGTFGKTSLGNESSYNSGFSLIQYISEKYGFEKVKEISYNMSSVFQFTIDGAIEKALGKTGEQVYNEWREFVKEDYNIRSKKITQNEIMGEIIEPNGFGNFYPIFSSNGEKIYYTSNQNHDYFGASAIFEYDLNLKKSKQVTFGVRSDISLSPDSSKIFYSKHNAINIRGELYYDIYYYDIDLKKESRLTFGKRAYSPSMSPDGSKITYISQKDGTVNLFIINSDAKEETQLTLFGNQEQIYSPKWSPDGTKITFSYSTKDNRDIAVVDATGENLSFLLSESYDERNPVFSKDGKYIYYSSNMTGIFNIYRYDIAEKKNEQLTNVLGGAFMPNLNSNGDLVFSLYHFGGFKIALIKNAQPLTLNDNDYIIRYPVKKELFNKWTYLNNYDDTKLENFKVNDYSYVFQSLSFYPILRFDNYNTHNRFIDNIKPGLYIGSSDILEKYGFFAGGFLNLKMERDLFLMFDYKDRIPFLYNLGLTPILSMELYSISRATESNIELPLWDIPVDVGLNMMELNLSATHKIINNRTYLKFLYRYSKYWSVIGNFVLPDIGQQVRSSTDDYLKGSMVELDFSTKNILPSRFQEINPIGYKLRLKLDYEMNDFNGDNEYEIKNGLLFPKYKKYNFPRLEIKYTHSVPLPFWSHTFAFEINSANIFGPPVDEFFNYYIGGFSGMKGYTYYAIGGNDALRLSAAYRFPIATGLDFKLAHIYFDKLYVSLFFDYGNAWVSGTKINDFKKDIGLELRLETFSFYMYPTRIFVSSAYGFDEFTNEYNKKQITYGKEWKFYLGVLFGFDIFDIN